jgi:hypothetical protein
MPGPRGDLLFPMLVEIAQLDTATATFDHTFRTYVPGTPRRELPTFKILAQVETGRFGAQNQLIAGNAPDSMMSLVFHFKHLESMNLVEADGTAKIRVNDRLVAIWDRTGSFIETSVKIPEGGLYMTAVEPIGIGLGGRRNLLLATLNDRPKGLAANPS